jgi:hypothetical protein
VSTGSRLSLQTGYRPEIILTGSVTQDRGTRKPIQGGSISTSEVAPPRLLRRCRRAELPLNKITGGCYFRNQFRNRYKDHLQVEIESPPGRSPAPPSAPTYLYVATNTHKGPVQGGFPYRRHVIYFIVIASGSGGAGVLFCTRALFWGGRGGGYYASNLKRRKFCAVDDAEVPPKARPRMVKTLL